MVRMYSQLECNLNTDTFYNASVSGAVIADCVSRAATVDSKIVTETKTLMNLMILWIGVNEVTESAGTGLTAYNNLKTYVQARKLVGWKIFVYTMTPSTSGGRGVQFEIERGIFNGLLKSDLASISKVIIIDTDTNSHFNMPSDLDYYEDSLYLSGKGIIAANDMFISKFISVFKLDTPVIPELHEMVDQWLWCNATVAHLWWSNYFQAAWSADGSKLSCDGTDGFLSRIYLIAGKKYKVTMSVTLVSGYLDCVWDGVNWPMRIWKTGTITYYIKPTVTVLYITSHSFLEIGRAHV
jgi:hypothetical protein